MRVVIDTNVLFQGLTQPQSAAGKLIALWANRHPSLEVCVCNALQFEYQDVLIRMLSPQRWRTIKPIFDALLIHVELIDFGSAGDLAPWMQVMST